MLQLASIIIFLLFGRTADVQNHCGVELLSRPRMWCDTCQLSLPPAGLQREAAVAMCCWSGGLQQAPLRGRPLLVPVQVPGEEQRAASVPVVCMALEPVGDVLLQGHSCQVQQINSGRRFDWSCHDRKEATNSLDDINDLIFDLTDHLHIDQSVTDCLRIH